jgi:hypothetical protein
MRKLRMGGALARQRRDQGNPPDHNHPRWPLPQLAALIVVGTAAEGMVRKGGLRWASKRSLATSG